MAGIALARAATIPCSISFQVYPRRQAMKPATAAEASSTTSILNPCQA